MMSVAASFGVPGFRLNLHATFRTIRRQRGELFCGRPHAGEQKKNRPLAVALLAASSPESIPILGRLNGVAGTGQNYLLESDSLVWYLLPN